jgi:hypothetical protein
VSIGPTILDVDDRVNIVWDRVFCPQVASELGLERGEAEFPARIMANDPVHCPVAKIAYPIKQDDPLHKKILQQ